MPDRQRPGPAPATHDAASGRPPPSCWPPGEGTRMRSADRRSCTRSPAAACSAHAVHAVAELEPEHLVVVVGHGRDEVARRRRRAGRASWPGRCSPPCRTSSWAPGTPCGARWPTLPADLAGPGAGQLRRRAAARRRRPWPRWPPSTTWPGAALTLLTSEPADPFGYGRVLRDSGRHRRRDRRAGRRDRRAAGRARGQLRRLRLRRRRSSATALEPAAPGEQPGRALPHRPGRDRPRRRTRRCARVRCPDHVAGERRQRPGAAGRGTGRAEPAAAASAGCSPGVTVVDPASTWVDVQVAARARRRAAARAPSCTAPRRWPAAPRSARTPRSPTARSAPAPRSIRTHGTEASIGAGATVGPFAYLRPGARLGERGKIGTFVEVKNADIGAGIEGAAPHICRATPRSASTATSGHPRCS